MSLSGFRVDEDALAAKLTARDGRRRELLAGLPITGSLSTRKGRDELAAAFAGPWPWGTSPRARFFAEPVGLLWPVWKPAKNEDDPQQSCRAGGGLMARPAPRAAHRTGHSAFGARRLPDACGTRGSWLVADTITNP